MVSQPTPLLGLKNRRVEAQFYHFLENAPFFLKFQVLPHTQVDLNPNTVPVQMGLELNSIKSEKICVLSQI
jgi:hypothetical protein